VPDSERPGRRGAGPAEPAAPTLGLRERRRMRTMGAIQQAALRLFAEQGFERTTVEQIAAAADISPATFFRYYPAKEAVVRSDEFDLLIARGLAERPPEEGLYEAVRASVRAVLPYIERAREAVLERYRLVVSSPGLRAQLVDAQRANTDWLAAALASRLGRNPADLQVRVIAAAIVAASFEAMAIWADSDGRLDLGQLLDGALDALARPPGETP
jgi:AcrR family transcriptional regulator